MPTTFEKPEELLNAVGQHLGFSDWVEVTQERIDQFAEATGDHQWIHTDPERAKAGPFGKTIAHGYLTQSMVSLFVPQIVTVRGIMMAINYGTNRVRFPAAVTVGSKIRGGAELVAASCSCKRGPSPRFFPSPNRVPTMTRCGSTCAWGTSKRILPRGVQ